MMRPLRIIRRIIIIAMSTAALIFAGLYYYMEYVLYDVDALNSVQLQVPLQVFTQDRKLIATFGEKRRIPLPYAEIPQQLIHAVLATEDQRYFQHPGVDLPGLGRAAIQLLVTGRKSQGGSTITMQVARSFYLSRHKTFARKLREILLAIKIEHNLTKEKILELYLNKVFLGNRAYGVEAAAEIYYGKHLNQLRLDQFAILGGLPQAPSTLNPIANPQAAKKRRDHVLARMREQGYISETEYLIALKAPIDASYHDLKTEVTAPYVAELARTQLERMYGDAIYTDGFRVYTTVDSKLQNDANLALRDNLLSYDQRHGYRGPQENLGIVSIENLDDWQQQLHKMQVINGLEPAVVVELTDKTISVLRANGEMTIIPWQGLSWARKQLNANYLGAMPSHAAQIVKPGDLVRIMKTDTGFRLAQLPKAEAALVALNPINGAILAMVGGFDYQHSKFNRVTRAERQPGSSFKPFIYSAAFEKGLTLATVINDAPIVIENPSDHSLWRPQNDTHKFYGPTRLRTAIIESRNLVSIRVLALMGVPFAVDHLKKFGFTNDQLPKGLSLALGTAMVTPLQMAQAYAIFANGGQKVMPFIIDRIENTNNSVIYQAKPYIACSGKKCPANAIPAPRVLSAENAYLVTSALKDVIARGTAKMAKNLGRSDLAGKTGTTQNQVDAWFAGYNPSLVTIAWVGFDQPISLHEYGAKAALPMWMQFMEAALKNKPEKLMLQPPGIVSIRIDPANGYRAAANAPSAIFENFMLPFTPDKESNIETSSEGESTEGGSETTLTDSESLF